MLTGRHIRLGPLDFIAPLDVVGESVGDGLEAVGAALIAAERRPRGLKLKLPVRGYERDDDPREAGLRLRRQVRQVFDNARWRLQGFYFVFDPDPDLDCWLLVGTAEINETDPGLSFGEFELDLGEVYIAGRPGTHRPGRRASIADLRTGLVPRDTRRKLYTTDFSAQALPTEPLFLPGDAVDLVRSSNQTVTNTAGTLRSGRRLWRSVAGSDGEVFTYLPDDAVLSGRERYLGLDELGSVRVWDLENAEAYPPVEADYTTAEDTDPTLMGWEQVLGDVLSPDHPLAMDNGLVRLVWLGAAAGEGLAVEYWDDDLERYHRAGRVLHALDVREQRVVEATPERAVLEWRAGRYAMRAILQRGWWGPRLESYDDGGSTARLEWAPSSELTPTVAASTPSWVRSVDPMQQLSYDEEVLADSPSLFWPSITHTSALDVSGNARHGAISGAPGAGQVVASPIAGDSGTGLDLDGADDYIGSTYNPFTNGTVRTFEGWAWRDNNATNDALFGSDAGVADCILRCDSGGQNVTFLPRSASSVTWAAAWPGNAQWVHWALKFDETNNTAELVINGVSQTVKAMAEAYDATPGNYRAGSRASTSPAWDGRLAKLAVYEHGLSGARILAHAQAPTEGLTGAPMLWASGSNDETVDTTPTVITGPAATWRRTLVLVGQLSFPPGPSASDLASRSLVDARPVPVLVGRG